jgi:hypothetical protein
MGDRANVVIRTKGNPDLFLYTHWRGDNLDSIVHTALTFAAESNRLRDDPYLARIIFCEMVGDHLRDATGFGISTVLTDNEHPIIVIDVDSQTIGLAAATALDRVEGAIPIADFIGDQKALKYD